MDGYKALKKRYMAATVSKSELFDEIDRLRAENEALRPDAERYQYIKNKRGGIGWMLTTWEDFDLDAAIDHSLCGEEE